ncbi:MAG: toll/interleukin-1 receptor domain-containing protein [Parvularculaceae bacterium]
MARSVFISYAREDRAKVEKLARALEEHGLSVWWDPKIKTGAGFRQEISEALAGAHAVIVMWSQYSVGSRFVCDEADEGASKDILFPALLDNVDIPLGFRQIQTADLTHWRGRAGDPALLAFVETIAEFLGAARRRSGEPVPAPPEDGAPAESRPAPKPKRAPPKRKQSYTTTGAKRRLALITQSLLLALLIAAGFGALAYTSDFVFPEYRPIFIGAMAVLAFLSRYGTLEADRAAGAASLALLSRSFLALILFSMISIAPVVLEGRLYAAALEGVQIRGIEGADINGVTLDDKGERLLTASDDSTVRLWDAKTGVQLGEFSDHEHWVWAADFSPDGSKAVSASRDLTARIWSTENGAALQTLSGHLRSVYDVVWHPGGEAVATASSDNTVIIWNPVDGTAVRTIGGHNDSVNAIDFSPDGDLLASVSADGNVRLWNWRTGARLTTVGLGSAGDDIAFSGDGAYFAAAGENGKARAWDTAARRRVMEVDHGAKAFAVRFVDGGRKLATGGIDGIVRIWSVPDGEMLSELEGHKDAVRALDAGPDGTVLASGSRDNTARLWDVAGGEQIQIMGHVDSAISLPIAIDLPPVFVASRAPVPVKFFDQPETGGLLLAKGVGIAFAALVIGLLLKGLLWLVRLRPLARWVLTTALFLIAAYVGLLMASALPGEALSLWLTLAFAPAAAFALLRWILRALVFRSR